MRPPALDFFTPGHNGEYGLIEFWVLQAVKQVLLAVPIATLRLLNGDILPEAGKDIAPALE